MTASVWQRQYDRVSMTFWVWQCQYDSVSLTESIWQCQYDSALPWQTGEEPGESNNSRNNTTNEGAGLPGRRWCWVLVCFPQPLLPGWPPGCREYQPVTARCSRPGWVDFPLPSPFSLSLSLALASWKNFVLGTCRQVDTVSLSLFSPIFSLSFFVSAQRPLKKPSLLFPPLNSFLGQKHLQSCPPRNLSKESSKPVPPTPSRHHSDRILEVDFDHLIVGEGEEVWSGSGVGGVNQRCLPTWP